MLPHIFEHEMLQDTKLNTRKSEPAKIHTYEHNIPVELSI